MAARPPSPDLEGWALANIAAEEIQTGDLRGAADHLQLGLPMLVDVEDHVAAFSSLDAVGRVLARSGDGAGAAIAWSAATAMATMLGIPLDRDAEDQSEIDRTRDALGPSEWQESSQRGAELNLAEAVDLLIPRLGDVAGP